MQSANVAPARPKVARRNYLIDRGFQLKYTIIMVVVGAAISLLFGAMMYQAHVEATQLMDLPDPYKGVVASHDSTLLWVVMAIAVVMAVALGIFGVLVTHRVAGPIYVFSHYVGVLGQGRYPALRPLRKNDELKSFFEAIHAAVASMRARDKSEGEALQEIVAAMESASGQSSEAAKALQPAIAKARELAQRHLAASTSEDPATPGQKAEHDARNAA